MTSQSLPPHPVDGTIAIVDDDPEICDVLQAWLQTLGVSSVSYPSAEQLLAHVRGTSARRGSLMLDSAVGSPVHVIGAVLDINLPDLNGAELADILLSIEQLPIVLVSAQTDALQRVYHERTELVQHLSKPFDLTVLEAMLAPALTR